MRRHIWIGLGILMLLLAGVVLWGYGYVRHVDGRSPAQWVAYADQASQRVTYHAEGRSLTDGTRAHFVLDQGMDGRYAMTTRDAHGRRCSLGYDGKQVWYASGAKQEKVAVSRRQETPMPKRAQILGTATMAGSPVVRLAVSDGRVRKTLAIDRNTGVVLAQSMRVHRRLQSEMTIDRVEYRPVDVPSCAMDCQASGNAVDRATLAARLGGTIVEPRWLPKGFVLTEMLLAPCGECGQPMGVLHYSDGISAITLFEMSRHAMMCDMGTGCRQTGDGHAVIANATVGAHAVTVVGTVDAPTLRKVLAHLQ